MEQTPQESALIVASKELHALAAKELNGEGGDSFLSIIVENDKVAVGCYGQDYSIAFGIAHALAKNPEVSKTLMTEVKNTPGFIESVLLFLLEQDTDSMPLNEEQRKAIANGLRELADKIDNPDNHAEDTDNKAQEV